MTAAHPLPCELVLSSGHVVLLDPEDYAWASRWSWRPHTSCAKRGLLYPYRAFRVGGRKGRCTGEFLHRAIMGAGPGQVVDHVSGDTLDCRRANLRITDARGNSRNVRSSKLQKRGGLKGVYLVKKSGKWAAAIGAGPVQPNGKAKRIHLGCFGTPEDAARAYDRAALEHFGTFAALNYPIAPIDGDPQRSAPELYAEPAARAGGAS